MRARTIAGVVCVLLLCLGVSAQSAFEAASIKPNTTGSFGWSITYTADSLRATNATLASLIQSAYGILLDDRLVAGPGWVRTSRFDVNAKAGRALPREQLRLMAQRLLENRFGVVLTRERREQQVYELHVARADGRTGPDLHRAPDDCIDSAADRPIPQSSTGSAPTTHGRCAAMPNLATLLSRILQAAVVDRTGLAGRWDFALAYTRLAPEISAALEQGKPGLPTIFVAVREQLGLTLERSPRGSVEYVVIAAAHAPTEN
jgi:uncharacterized protein (TIGR03435 family)